MRPLGLRILPLILLTASAGRSQEPVVNPAPQPPVALPPVEVTAPAGRPETPDPSVHPPGEIPPTEVTPKHFSGNPAINISHDSPFRDIVDKRPVFEKPIPVRRHPFVFGRTGPLIRAIFWKHNYLQYHPQEQAVIVPIPQRDHSVSTMIFWTNAGLVYGNSEGLRRNFLLEGISPAKLATPEGVIQARRYMQALLNNPNARGEAAAGNPVGNAVQDMSDGLDLFEETPDSFYAGRPRENLAWTYSNLHDPEKAGMLPVALGQITGQGGPGDTPPFAYFARSPGASGIRPTQFLTFDLDGTQYYYNPDVGTFALPLPLNAITRLPELGLRGGARIECVYFCATFARQHPGNRAVVVAGEPAAAAFERDGRLCLLIPVLGGFALPADYLPALSDPGHLSQIRDQVVAAKRPSQAAAAAIPDGIKGDDSDMEMRRAFLALQAAGVPCELSEKGSPSLQCDWAGVSYAYGADQSVRSSADASGNLTSPSFTGPTIKLPEIREVEAQASVPPETAPPEMDLPASATGNPAPPTASVPDRAILLPPVIVSATRLAKNPWRYLNFANFEVLSRASEADTSWELNALLRAQAVQEAVLPADWFPPALVPFLAIIDDPNLTTAQPEPIQTPAATTNPPSGASGSGRPPPGKPVANESITTAENAARDHSPTGVGHGGFPYASGKLTTLLRATPPLPDWVLAGLFGRNGLFREGFIFETPKALPGRGGASAADLRLQSGTFRTAFGPGTIWISPAETQRLLKASFWTRIPLLPLAELFSEDHPSASDGPRWESEAGLFLRWGLIGPGRDDPASFHSFLRFVERARREPVNEPMFVACFGYDYGVMEEKLGYFLKEVLSEPTIVRNLNIPSTYPTPSTRRATPDESGRILGDWLRVQAEDLRAKNPPLSSGLLSLSGRMLLRAYRDDNALLPDQLAGHDVAAIRIQDPSLLAVFGLYEHDSGNDAKAQELLEAALAAKVARPQAYLVLAEIRSAEAAAHPQAQGGRLTAAQANTILGPLREALRFSPDPEAYDLMADTWLRCESSPPASNLALLAAGAAFFPRSTVLAYKAALVCNRAGDRPRAITLIDRALAFAVEPSAHESLQALRANLGAHLDAAVR